MAGESMLMIALLSLLLKLFVRLSDLLLQFACVFCFYGMMEKENAPVLWGTEKWELRLRGTRGESGFAGRSAAGDGAVREGARSADSG